MSSIVKNVTKLLLTIVILNCKCLRKYPSTLHGRRIIVTVNQGLYLHIWYIVYMRCTIKYLNELRNYVDCVHVFYNMYPKLLMSNC